MKTAGVSGPSCLIEVNDADRPLPVA